MLFICEIVSEALRKNRSAGLISSASAILNNKSNEGNCRADSMQPIVGVAQSHISASFDCEIFF